MQYTKHELIKCQGEGAVNVEMDQQARPVAGVGGAEDKKPLWHDIKKFSKQKIWLAILFIILGIPGLVLPVIPGLLLLGVAVFLIKPEWFDKFRRRFGLGK